MFEWQLNWSDVGQWLSNLSILPPLGLAGRVENSRRTASRSAAGEAGRLQRHVRRLAYTNHIEVASRARSEAYASSVNLTSLEKIAVKITEREGGNTTTLDHLSNGHASIAEDPPRLVSVGD